MNICLIVLFVLNQGVIPSVAFRTICGICWKNIVAMLTKQKWLFKSSVWRLFRIYPRLPIIFFYISNLWIISFNNDTKLSHLHPKPDNFFRRRNETLPEHWKLIVNITGEYLRLIRIFISNLSHFIYLILK